jgi:predicted RNase H-like nuclease (RuvC/YqgF family)
MGLNNTKYKLKIKTKGRERNFINRNPSQEEDGSIFKTGQLTDFEKVLFYQTYIKQLKKEMGMLQSEIDELKYNYEKANVISPEAEAFLLKESYVRNLKQNLTSLSVKFTNIRYQLSERGLKINKKGNITSIEEGDNLE